MNVDVITSAIKPIPNPMAVNMHKVCEYKGFEIWKGDAGVRAHIYFRYTAFGKPFIVKQVGFMFKPMMDINRMVFCWTPFTSVKAFKDFVKEHVREV